jgi:single-stranded DNA-binding protein
METSINTVTLSGILQERILRTTKAGDPVVNATLLIVEGRDDKPRKQLLRFVAWERLAERVAELPKGTKVRITGRLETVSWPAKDTGKMMSRVQVVADCLERVNSLQDTSEKVIVARPGPKTGAITPSYSAPQYPAAVALGGQG